MKRRWSSLLLVGLASLGAIGLTVVAQENDDADEQVVTSDQVPVPVQAALARLAGGAKIARVCKDTEHRVDLFEGQWIVGGLTCKAEVTADGTVLEIEEDLAASDVPPAVQQAAAKHLAGADQLTFLKKTIILYEVQGRVGGKHREVAISPTGQIGRHEHEDDDHHCDKHKQHDDDEDDDDGN